MISENKDIYDRFWSPSKFPMVCLMVERIVMLLSDIILNVYRRTQDNYITDAGW